MSFVWRSSGNLPLSLSTSTSSSPSPSPSTSLPLSFLLDAEWRAPDGVTSKATQRACENNCHNFHYQDETERRLWKRDTSKWPNNEARYAAHYHNTSTRHRDKSTVILQTVQTQSKLPLCASPSLQGHRRTSTSVPSVENSRRHPSKPSIVAPSIEATVRRRHRSYRGQRHNQSPHLTTHQLLHSESSTRLEHLDPSSSPVSDVVEHIRNCRCILSHLVNHDWLFTVKVPSHYRHDLRSIHQRFTAQIDPSQSCHTIHLTLQSRRGQHHRRHRTHRVHTFLRRHQNSRKICTNKAVKNKTAFTRIILVTLFLSAIVISILSTITFHFLSVETKDASETSEVISNSGTIVLSKATVQPATLEPHQGAVFRFLSLSPPLSAYQSLCASHSTSLYLPLCLSLCCTSLCLSTSLPDTPSFVSLSTHLLCVSLFSLPTCCVCLCGRMVCRQGATVLIGRRRAQRVAQVRVQVGKGRKEVNDREKHGGRQNEDDQTLIVDDMKMEGRAHTDTWAMQCDMHEMHCANCMRKKRLKCICLHTPSVMAVALSTLNETNCKKKSLAKKICWAHFQFHSDLSAWRRMPSPVLFWRNGFCN